MVSLDGTQRPGGEDSEGPFDRRKGWARGGCVREVGFSSEQGCPVMQDRPARVSSSAVRAFPHC